LLYWTKHYGLASGSKLNASKTKGLWLGKWEDNSVDMFGITWCKKVKICGAWYGIGFSPGEFWQPLLSKLIQILNLWKIRRLSFTGKANIINILACSKLWYVASAALLPKYYVKLINFAIFKFFWGAGSEPVARKTLYLCKNNGGFNLVNVECKAQSLLLKHLQCLVSNPTAKWTYFARYWIGLQLRRHNSALADNLFPSSEYIPLFNKYCMKILNNVIEKDPSFVLGNYTAKQLYDCLLQPVLLPTKASQRFPHIDFISMWPNLYDNFVDSHYIDTSWRLAHDVVSVNAVLHRFGMYRSSICPYEACTAVESVQHCFFECKVVKPVYSILLPWVEKLSSTTIPYIPDVIPCDFLRFPRHLNALNKYRRSVLLYLIALTKHIIWISRNKTKHQHKRITSNLIIVTFLSILKFRILADFKRFTRSTFTKYWLSTDCFCRISDDKVVCKFM
jgi:hypothetical protein